MKHAITKYGIMALGLVVTIIETIDTIKWDNNNLHTIIPAVVTFILAMLTKKQKDEWEKGEQIGKDIISEAHKLIKDTKKNGK